MTPIAPEHRKILDPFAAVECISIAEAASESGMEGQTIRNWCAQHGLGRKIGAQWKVSRVAFRMFLNGDASALVAYHSGDRTSQLVVGYYVREGLAGVLRSPAFVALTIEQTQQRSALNSKNSIVQKLSAQHAKG